MTLSDNIWKMSQQRSLNLSLKILKFSTLWLIPLVSALIPSSIMFTCQCCGVQFPSKAEYTSHTRVCTGEVITFVHKEQTIRVRKVGEGFPCYCSDVGCANGTKIYKNKVTLRNHMTRANSVWIGPRLDVSVIHSMHVC